MTTPIVESPVTLDRRNNVDSRTVAGFGSEWSRYDQSQATVEELDATFERYFSVFPWERISPGSIGFDLGCGTGRWAQRLAPRVGKLFCVDASGEALAVAKRNLAQAGNCEFVHASVGALPFADESMDFCYSLGVLHHVPNTEAGIDACVRKLKIGAPFLLYLYYAFDNRPRWFRLLWGVSDLVRRGISKLPQPLKVLSTEAVAGAVYWPLARTSALLERMGAEVDSFPLAAYRHHSFYTMRTDSLDRLGTRLEQRFTREEIRGMMQRAGLVDIRFRDGAPYWCASGIRAR